MKRINHHEYVRLHYGNISEGTTANGSVRCGCYRVDGMGDSPSQCHLDVTKRDGVLLYICRGAKCGIRGAVKLDSRTRKQSEHGISDKGIGGDGQRSRSLALPSGFIRSLPGHAIQWLEQYAISQEEIVKWDIGWDRSAGRLILPVQEDGIQRGYCSRRIEGVGGAKWYNIIPDGYAFPVVGGGNTALVVENPLSAIRVNKLTGLPAIALFGHTCNARRSAYIRKWCSDNSITSVKLLLDPDVDRLKKKNLKRILTNCVSHVQIADIDKKPRDLTEEELKCLIQ